MYAPFESDEVICVPGLRQPKAFFVHLPQLLPGEEWTIGVGCYEPDERFVDWLGTIGEVSVPKKFNFKWSFDANRSEYPRGGAFYIKATGAHLGQLAGFARQTQSIEQFIDHVIGFEGETALFSFHDAFQGPDLLVSTMIPQSSLGKFCSSLGVNFQIIANPQRK